MTRNEFAAMVDMVELSPSVQWMPLSQMPAKIIFTPLAALIAITPM